MSLQPVAVKNYSVKISANGGQSPGSYADDFQVVEPESSTNEAEGKKVINSPIVWVAQGCSLSGYSFIAGGGAFVPNTQKTKSNGLPHQKEGCQGFCVGAFVLNGSPPTPYVCTCTLEITDANQTKVEAE